MPRLSRSLFLASGLLLVVGAGNAAPPGPLLDARALSARIDECIEVRLAREGVPPAPPADDAEFFRRLSLDLNGRIPSLAQLLDFLDDTRADKRRLWSDELLDGRDNNPLYVNHFTNVWRRRLLAHTPAQAAAVAGPLEGWLRKQVKADAPYDRIVRGLLTDPEAAGFLQANENKPENLAAAVSRLFLGLKLECAQCHDDRSGGNWKRAQFWEFAAFFAGLRGPDVRSNAVFVIAPREETGPPRIKIGETDAWAEAGFLDGARPDWKADTTPRAVLAGWITRADNPWFARAAVNRTWRDLFGVGLIDPVDGLGVADCPPSHPELLDELAAQFAAHEFDMKYLLRALTGSRAYQRTSRQTDPRQLDARLFAQAAVRSLSAVQLLDSLRTATGSRPKGGASPGQGFGRDTPEAEFAALFEGAPGGPLDSQASIQQALAMMNGKFVEEATSPDNSPILAAVSGGKSSRTAARRIEELYLVVLSRKPRPEELTRLVKHVEDGDPKQAMRDVLWALLNSTEFVVNH
jgi:hypothetical protein